MKTALTAMDKKAILIHISICIIIGGTISFFTSVKWLAASFWVSAALFVNGSLAFYEDAKPGGFENPNGEDTPEFVKGRSALKFWTCSLSISIGLVAMGLFMQKCAPYIW